MAPAHAGSAFVKVVGLRGAAIGATVGAAIGLAVRLTISLAIRLAVCATIRLTVSLTVRLAVGSAILTAWAFRRFPHLHDRGAIGGRAQAGQARGRLGGQGGGDEQQRGRGEQDTHGQIPLFRTALVADRPCSAAIVPTDLA